MIAFAVNCPFAEGSTAVALRIIVLTLGIFLPLLAHRSCKHSSEKKIGENGNNCDRKYDDEL
jgi:hypothetical protein